MLIYKQSKGSNPVVFGAESERKLARPLPGIGTVSSHPYQQQTREITIHSSYGHNDKHQNYASQSVATKTTVASQAICLPHN